jgi:hypothetical protein
MMAARQEEAGDGSTGVFEQQIKLSARGLRYVTLFDSTSTQS